MAIVCLAELENFAFDQVVSAFPVLALIAAPLIFFVIQLYLITVVNLRNNVSV